MVNSTTFHLQSTENPRINGYSDRFSKGTSNYLNTQILIFLENVTRVRKRKGTIKLNKMLFHEWQIVEYFKNWNLILFIKDNFSYKNFTERRDLDIETSWFELKSYLYTRNFLRKYQVYPIIKRLVNKKSKFTGAIKLATNSWIPRLNFLLVRVLLYLNFILFRLPLILEMKKFFYNFIFFNFFRDQFHYTKKFQIIFCITTEDYPSSFIISEFIAKKLIERFSVSLILRRVLSYMLGYFRLNLVEGFRIFIKGRVTRKERMTYKWVKRGKLSLNSKFAAIDFFNRTLAMRYGTCSIQIWIQK